jgi:hypothetical protein
MFKLKLFAFTICSFITVVGIGWYGKYIKPSDIFYKGGEKLPVIKETIQNYTISPTGALLYKTKDSK